MTPSPLPSSQASEPRRPRSASKVSVNIAEGSQNNGRRFQLEVSECVETKTVTTTTRLTRKFPRVFVRDPTPLESLDTKEYPLAMKPTPPELLDFSYNVAEEDRAADECLDEEEEKDAALHDVNRLIVSKPVSCKKFLINSPHYAAEAVVERGRQIWISLCPRTCIDNARTDEATRNWCLHSHPSQNGTLPSRDAFTKSKQSSTITISFRRASPTHPPDSFQRC